MKTQIMTNAPHGFLRLLAVGLLGLTLAACEVKEKADEISSRPAPGGEVLAQSSSDYRPLNAFSRRSSPITVAVYDFPDFTGANKQSENFAELSKAVSQGAEAYVVSALRTVGKGSWFQVVERRFLEPLLQERRIVINQANENRQRIHVSQERARLERERDSVETEIARVRAQIERDYNQPGAANPNLPPLDQTLANLERYRQELIGRIQTEVPFSPFTSPNPIANLKSARYLVTGAVVAYDHDVSAGGTGLRIFNVGIVDEQRKDIITVDLRFVDVVTGEIVASKTVTQTVVSQKKQGDVLNYVTVNTVLEFESGHVVNEPRSFALEAAIRRALSDVLLDMRARKLI